VTADRAKAKEMIISSGQKNVPVIAVDGDIVVGFDRARLESLLAG